MISAEEALSYGQGTWRSFSCPVHADSNPSARINVISRKWVCMSCHAKGIANNINVDPDKQLESIKLILNQEKVRERPESWWDQFDSYIHPYWLGRFSEDVSKLYRLGYDAVKERPCYPLWRGSAILGPVHRNMDYPDGPKYRYPLGSNTSELIFGSRELSDTDTLVMVEGAMDVIAVREAGHDAISTYGSKLHPKQIQELRRLGIHKVFVAYDNDRAGRTGAQEAVTELKRSGIWAQNLWWNDRWSDLGDMDLETRKEILAKTLD